MSDRKAVIKNADMSEEMQQDSVEFVILAIGKYNVERGIAALIKRVTTGDQTAVVKDTDMSEHMQRDAVECALQSPEECNVEHDMAAHRKRISVCL